MTTPRGRWLSHPSTRITNPYGASGDYSLGWHTGVDLAVPGASRVPIVWALRRPGLVTRVGWDDYYGRFVIVRGQKGNEWLFAHLDRIHVRVGQRLPNGTQIGLTGSTGNATGDHLHLERGRGKWAYGRVSRPLVFDYEH